MARPAQTQQRRMKTLPILAQTFAELGYRRTTTAELAQRCEVQENILYRLWPDKKAMFLAAIDYVYELSSETWDLLLQNKGTKHSPAERILEYEAKHHGESGLYRLVFAGLSETDDPEIQDTLRKMYGRFHSFIHQQIAGHRMKRKREGLPDASLSAWAVVGLGTVSNIVRELGLMSDPQRKRLIMEIGRLLLEGQRS